MFSDVKAVIFDLDGTLYNFKWMPLRLIWSLPTDFFRIKAFFYISAIDYNN